MPDFSDIINQSTFKFTLDPLLENTPASRSGAWSDASGSNVLMEECWVIDDSTEGFKNGLLVDQWMHSYGFVSPWDELQMLFWKFDTDGFGEMSMDHFRSIVFEPEFREGVSQIAGVHSLRRLEQRSERHQNMTYQEFVDLVSNKRRRSFKVAVHERDGEVSSLDNFATELPHRHDRLSGKMVHKIAKEFLPDPKDRKYYEDQYSCCPPPIFILFITLVELAFSAYYAFVSGGVDPNGPVPIDSIFVYRPDRRIEMWRFLFYMVLHAGWVHLLFNLVVQVLVGLPLEMVHGSLRIATVYFAGVLAGSLGTSVFDTDVYLVGASGGVYALLAAHVSNVLLNYSHMECGIFRIFCIFIIASADVGFAIWNRYSAVSPSSPPDTHPVSYVAHLAGGLAGLTIGLVVLKNFERKLYEKWLWWIALVVYLSCVIFAVLWNVFGYPPDEVDLSQREIDSDFLLVDSSTSLNSKSVESKLILGP